MPGLMPGPVCFSGFVHNESPSSFPANTHSSHIGHFPLPPEKRLKMYYLNVKSHPKSTFTATFRLVFDQISKYCVLASLTHKVNCHCNQDSIVFVKVRYRSVKHNKKSGDRPTQLWTFDFRESSNAV